ncbi:MULTISPECIES: peptidylprolyl isomerase [Bacillus]|jgi:foldase protein PrsA|uniref:Foldase protein PrsA n=1 Tax=Bacillus amyloliquefaciens (strain ATCC 23350 / DSM 7 / BCRC 11601 / CCUG 28519 / NBRC 15535 / NRRL B-14393 / F) TaxID=692420 RepID=A0A9P1JFI1_BACAS|nr:peptidylprolyl isomerase [Bacillus amyloliquefaciens]ARW38241.1 Peptidylprolyl isomerase [Bacillus amyloliquefaciens]AZV88542.1 foldase PrsA [Bacillus amyloliquefaciens]KYC92693.1 Foldase protein PrsA precursor [Bacillus amyloliquefaciens]MBW8279664.1 peptidylprolyl isomerase [Bacillus amyloliquefaciens]MDR4375372.1 peptidylprolyl isomerase PrsA [Bacillus amyloliquefaciens]
MKKIAIATITATSVLALSACSSGDNDVIAKTDAGNVTKGELYTNMKKTAGASVLTQLVQEKVLAKKYKVSDKEIDNKLKEYKTQLGDQYSALKQQYGEDYLKDQVKYELLAQKAAKDNIKVTDSDTKEYYDGLKGKIRASHILVADKKTADEVEKKLKKGEKFETLAKEYSTDSSKDNGGDLGWFDKKSMDETFSKAAFGLKVGQVSDPVKTKFGYHIIKKTEERGKYDDMKKELKEEVLKQKLNDNSAVQAAIQKVMKKADVKVEDKDLKDTFNTSASTSSESK